MRRSRSRTESGPGIALLFDDGELGSQLRLALQAHGAQIVHEGSVASLSRDLLMESGAEVVVVNLGDEDDADRRPPLTGVDHDRAVPVDRDQDHEGGDGGRAEGGQGDGSLGGPGAPDEHAEPGRHEGQNHGEGDERLHGTASSPSSDPDPDPEPKPSCPAITTSSRSGSSSGTSSPPWVTCSSRCWAGS